jgi:hypothetical protein
MKRSAFHLAILNLVLIGWYVLDRTGIQCEPCPPDLPCPPCRTDYMELFPTLLVVVNATLLATSFATGWIARRFPSWNR